MSTLLLSGDRIITHEEIEAAMRRAQRERNAAIRSLFSGLFSRRKAASEEPRHPELSAAVCR